ncbi:MAG: phosphatidate cytidylyltransferase [Brachymonas sp.]|nr:phosphatidate cytidylyltransferase [Brachymonas sp.]
MLKQRIITALVLLAVLLAVLFYPSVWAFPLFMVVVVTAAAWEWARLSGYTGVSAWLPPVLALIGCVVMLVLGWHQAGWAGLRMLASAWVLVWTVLAIGLLSQGVPVWQRVPRGLRMAGGLLTLWMAWLGAVQLHGQRGVWYLLSALAMIWVADIGAYFAGRAFGKKKLAPTISPGKSWAGVYGGVLAVLVLVVAGALFLPKGQFFYEDVISHLGWGALLLLAVAITALSVMGDLVESLMKRSMGMKDSSQLLPGHGGLLDRVDSLLPVLPAALACMLWMQ